MIIINAKVTDTKLEFIDSSSIQEYQLNSAQIRFTFDETWNNYTKYVMFESYSGDQRLKQAIVGNVCTIPTNLEDGFVKLQVFGEKIEGDKIIQRSPTNVTSIHIARSINPTDDKEYPQADEWDIYVKNLNDYTKQVETYKQDIDTYKENTDSELSKIKEEQTNQSNLINSNSTETNEKITKIDETLIEHTNQINNAISSIGDNKSAIITLENKSGSTIELSIDNSTYVITLELKNASDEVISTQSIDLPLETMVVNADYKKNTKEIEITLQNGNKTSFSVADLISGLVSTETLEKEKKELQGNIDKNTQSIKDLNSKDFLEVGEVEEIDIEED